MPQKHWLVKQEPEAYSWDTFTQEGQTAWTGVRNFQARNNLRAMSKADWVLFYHSGEAKEVVGLAKVSRTAYPDPTATEGDWSAVDLVPVKPLRRPVTLAQIKADQELRNLPLVRNSRLSVVPVAPELFARLLELAETKP
jgi:predicted RNA-binding protein with PUA-like domain